MDPFKRILNVSADLAQDLPGHVFIGGVAIYLHAINAPETKKWAESSHDSDLMISLADFSDVRDAFEVVDNRRLGKHQIILEGVAFDVYVERHNNLIVPYTDVFAAAVIYEAWRVACLEHLLLLKLEAHVDREGTSKGEKDERDLVNIQILSGGKPGSQTLGSQTLDESLISPYLRDKHLQALENVAKGRVFVDLCKGNVHEAKKMRKKFEEFARTIAAMG